MAGVSVRGPGPTNGGPVTVGQGQLGVRENGTAALPLPPRWTSSEARAVRAPILV